MIVRLGKLGKPEKGRRSRCIRTAMLNSIHERILEAQRVSPSHKSTQFISCPMFVCVEIVYRVVYQVQAHLHAK